MSGSVKFQQSGQFLIISLEGYIEKTVSQTIVEKFRSDWTNGLKYFVFDFAKVTMINSIALSNFLDIVSEGIGKDDIGFFFCEIPLNTYFGISAVGLLNYATEFESLSKAKKELEF